MAYCLRSFIETLEQVLNPHQHNKKWVLNQNDRPQIQSLFDNATFLQDFLDKSSPLIQETISSLEDQIMDAAQKAADTLESYITDQLLSNPKDQSFTIFPPDMGEALHAFEVVKEEVIKIECASQPSYHNNMSSSVSRTRYPDSKNMVVGVEEDLNKLRTRLTSTQVTKLDVIPPIVGSAPVPKFDVKPDVLGMFGSTPVPKFDVKPDVLGMFGSAPVPKFDVKPDVLGMFGMSAPVPEFDVIEPDVIPIVGMGGIEEDLKQLRSRLTSARVTELDGMGGIVNMPKTHANTLINEKLSHLPKEAPDCNIYRVYRHLRNINNKAYDPEVISIGPYHHGKTNLNMLEKHKLLYLNSLLQRKKENVDKYVSAIKQLEQKARKCYAEPIDLNSDKFVEMLVLDGCFIVELVQKCSMMKMREKNDPIFNMPWIMISLQRDLMLFENQIPFFVLLKLFELVEVPDQPMLLIINFFNNLYPGKRSRDKSNRSPDTIKHLLDLIHCNWLPMHHELSFDDDETKSAGPKWRFIENAKGLKEANVEFQKCEDSSFFDIRFQNGTMVLPTLTVEDRTESFLRNLIAYEQYFQDSEPSFVTDYAKFMDCLIDNSQDVEILSRCGVIENWLGDDEAVAGVFNKLTDLVTGPTKRFMYGDIFDKVNTHSNKRRNRWVAIMRRNYLDSPWGVLSIIVAVVLLVLTIVQTVCSILQVLQA